ncbi:MAG: CinA family protein [Duodenibacillus sp.]|nr:CinA family protein [Duodenibacillus sp.]
MSEMSIEIKIEALAEELGRKALERGAVIASAESCTAGGISWAITRVPGSSAWFDRGFVVYTAQAKSEMLGVDSALIAACGVVSEPTAGAMASGALQRSEANVSVSVTGIAGPTGAEPGKPVGTVCFGFARKGEPVRAVTEHFSGDRRAVREQAVAFALKGLIKMLS